MTITLPPDLERRAEAEVAAGRAESVGALVERVLRAHFMSLEALRKSLDDAEQSYREGKGVPWETVRARLIERFGLDG